MCFLYYPQQKALSAEETSWNGTGELQQERKTHWALGPGKSRSKSKVETEKWSREIYLALRGFPSTSWPSFFTWASVFCCNETIPRILSKLVVKPLDSSSDFWGDMNRVQPKAWRWEWLPDCPNRIESRFQRLCNSEMCVHPWQNSRVC